MIPDRKPATPESKTHWVNVSQFKPGDLVRFIPGAWIDPRTGEFMIDAYSRYLRAPEGLELQIYTVEDVSTRVLYTIAPTGKDVCESRIKLYGHKQYFGLNLFVPVDPRRDDPLFPNIPESQPPTT